MKYLATVSPKPNHPDDFIPQYFTNAFVEAENEDEAEKIANSKGYTIYSIREVESSLAKTMLFIDHEIDEAKRCIKENINAEYFRLRLKILNEVMLIAQGGV